MKKCLICQKQINETEEFCNCCITFFKWKYNKGYINKLQRFKNLLNKKPSSNLNKFNAGGKK